MPRSSSPEYQIAGPSSLCVVAAARTTESPRTPRASASPWMKAPMSKAPGYSATRHARRGAAASAACASAGLGRTILETWNSEDPTATYAENEPSSPSPRPSRISTLETGPNASSLSTPHTFRTPCAGSQLATAIFPAGPATTITPHHTSKASTSPTPISPAQHRFGAFSPALHLHHATLNPLAMTMSATPPAASPAATTLHTSQVPPSSSRGSQRSGTGAHEPTAPLPRKTIFGFDSSVSGL
mmetsp:Transcript_13998/g.35695  ORF Transcript_13998/g.35695 Transcript_13998/m.35695 type:complete len:243 (+) Transcript_13998:969-1697(+)